MMNPRTPEQSEREAVLFDLKKAIQVSIRLYPPQPKSDGPLFLPIIWLHFTDIQLSGIDIDRLMNRGFVTLTRTKPPAFDDYRDDFPPSAYRLTFQGKYILDHPAEWVFGGTMYDITLPPTVE